MKHLLCMMLLMIYGFGYSQEINPENIKQNLEKLKTLKQDSSKVILLNDLAMFYKNSDRDKGKKLSGEALLIAEKINFEDGIANSKCILGVFYFEDGKYEQSLGYLNDVISKCKNKKYLSRALRCKGLVYTYQNNYSKGLDNLLQSLKISEETNDKSGIANNSSNLGIIYSELGKFELSKKYFEKGLKINTELKNDMNMSRDLSNLGNVYSMQKKYNNAIDYYKKAIVIIEKFDNNQDRAIIMGSMSECYLNLKDFEKALYYCEISLVAAKKLGAESLHSYNIALMGNIHLEMAKVKKDNSELIQKAKSNFLEALVIDKRLKILKGISSNYLSLSEAYTLEGNDKKALETFKIATSYKDSIFNSENKESIKNLEDKRTIELRDKKIKIKNLELETKEKQKWYFVSGLLLLSIIGGLLFKQSQNRKQTNRKLEILNSELDASNKIKARFFSILNHDLRAPVSNLIGFLHLQKNSPELLDEETKKRMENKTITGAENLLNSMEDILLWSKGQMENFQPQPKNIFVSQLFEDTKNHFESEEIVKISFENSENLTLFSDENYLKTIIRNLTGNAIKALETATNLNISKTPTIIWKAWKDNNHNYLSISDNGSGGSQDQFKALYDDTEVVGIKTGLGLHLIRDLATAINCEIVVDSQKNIGTIFTLKFL